MDSNWLRVSKKHPCPICEHPDWCGVSADGTAVHCQRVESAIRHGDAGWFHKISTPVRPPKPVIKAKLIPVARIAWDQLALDYHRNANLTVLAAELGVMKMCLDSLRAGWDGDAWTFPMRDARNQVVGIRRRLPSGRKFSVKGGHEGLFIPQDQTIGRNMFVCEGPTDTAAVESVGIPAVGRPSNTGGHDLLVAWIAKKRPRCVTIMADRDKPDSMAECNTMRGARRLRDAMEKMRIDAEIRRPPQKFKDVRDWVRSGARTKDLLGE